MTTIRTNSPAPSSAKQTPSGPSAKEKQTNDALNPNNVATHLIEAGLAEISAAGSLLIEEASERSTTRALSEAARGIELIVKALVAQVHWSQVFDDPSAASLSALASGEFKSASTDACLERLERLCGFKMRDSHRRLNSMRKKRNVFEHFGRVDNDQALRGAMGTALHVLVDLLSDAEDAGLLPSESSGAPATLAQELSTFDRFAQARMNDLRAGLVGSEAFECPSCSQHAATIDDGLDCRFCCTRTSPEQAANYYVDTVMNVSEYEVAKDGAEWPVSACCECGQEALVQLDAAEPGHVSFHELGTPV